MAGEGAAATTTRGEVTGRVPPGPRGNPLLGNILHFRRDTVDAIVSGWRGYGDAVCFRGVGSLFPIYLFAHPDSVQYILQDNFRNFRRAQSLVEKFRAVVGNGLVTSEGESWTRQRKLVQAAFQRDRLTALAGTFTDTTDEMLDRWRGKADRRETIDIQSEMMHLILAILTRALFAVDMSKEAAAVEESVAIQAKYLNDSLNAPIDIPERAPLPSQRRFVRARETLDSLVDGVIARRKASRDDMGDLLSLLLEARDEETGEAISDQQARDEIKTLLIAGHETTATTLGWTFYLLSKHPLAAERLRAEVAEVLDGRTPTADDIPKLRYTTMVLHEALRLYPPLWAVFRMPLEDDEIGGYPVPAGTSVVLSAYLTHRHPDFWENPEGFEPERFSPERSEGRHRYAYIPFGGGPRGCIGFPLAMMEMPLVVAQVTQRFRLDLAPGHPVVPESAISLRQKYGGLMMLEPA